MRSRLKGLIAAVHTPMHPDGRLNESAIEGQARAMEAQGIHGVFVCGTTGEGVSLSLEERRRVLERWLAEAPANLRVIAHVGHQSLPDSCALAAHAREVGAWAVSTSAPLVFKAETAECLIAYCAPIAAAAGDLPFYYYHSPQVIGTNVSMPQFLAQAREAIPTLAGMKFNSQDMQTYQTCVALDDGAFDLPFGVDEALLASLPCGAVAAIGSTYNYAAAVYHAMMEAFEQGDLETARARAQTTFRLVNLIQQYGTLAAGKVLMSTWGVDCGPPRPPLQPLSAGQKRNLLEKWQAIVDSDPALSAVRQDREIESLDSGTTTGA